MDYMQDLLPARTQDRNEQRTLPRMIRDNAVLEMLDRSGYQTVAFDTGYRTTELRTADYFLVAPNPAINSLEALLMETSGFAAYQELANVTDLPYVQPGYGSHRERIDSIPDMLPETTDLPGPKFVFAHVVPPICPSFSTKVAGRSHPPIATPSWTAIPSRGRSRNTFRDTLPN
jgi:hypothetical protein